MGRIAAHTQEQVFEAADGLAANGQEISPNALRDVLGRGSFSTLSKHIEAWQQARRAAPVPVVLEMPESVKAAFAQCWQAAATEAGKEIAAIREKADAEIKAVKRRLDEAMGEVSRLEEGVESASIAVEGAQNALATVLAESQQAATAAAASEAALTATVEQMRQQIDAQQAELARVHADADKQRRELEKANEYGFDLSDRVNKLQGALYEANATAQRADAAKSHAEEKADARQSELDELKKRVAEETHRNAEKMLRLERETTEAKAEAKTAVVELASATGELTVLRDQVATLNATVHRLTERKTVKAINPKTPQGGQS